MPDEQKTDAERRIIEMVNRAAMASREACNREIAAAVAAERERCAKIAREKAGGEPDGTCCNQMWWAACISVARAIKNG